MVKKNKAKAIALKEKEIAIKLQQKEEERLAKEALELTLNPINSSNGKSKDKIKKIKNNKSDLLSEFDNDDDDVVFK
jgi:hypothetical protein